MKPRGGWTRCPPHTNTQTPHIMTTLKQRKQAIDRAIASGALTSVETYNIIQIYVQGAVDKQALTKYMEEYHMDEELEMHLGK